MMDFATKNFLVLSSIVLAVSAALSMVVLGSYLAVFDWNLIWLIEYGDLTKLFLIGAALVSSVATMLIYQAQDMYSWIIKGAKSWKVVIWATVAINLLIHGVAVYYDVHSGNGLEFYNAFRGASFLLFVFVIYIAFRDYQVWQTGNWIAISNQIAGWIILLGMVGATYGYYVKDVVGANARDVWTKEEKFFNAKIIMLLSHHVAFIADKNIIVLPTSEITRIVSRPKL
jgi:hypothetical protein